MAKHKKGRRNKVRKPVSTGKMALLLAFSLCVVAAVLIFPSSIYENPQGGIELCGDNSEDYGPEIPESAVVGYTKPVIQSVVLPEKSDANSDSTIYVYATKEQKNYHLGNCKFAKASGDQMTLYEAYYLGFTPGRCCDAPAYTGVW